MRLSSFVTDPLGRSATCPYNADDHVTSTTDRDGRRTTFSYDSGGRETGETWYDSSGQVTGHITFTYDNTGRMTGADDPNALLTFTYDSGGNQLTQATSGPGTGQPDVTLTSAYDGNNNRTSLADNLSTSNTITYDYDLANRMTTIGFSASTGSYAVAFGYDSGGNVTSVDRLAPSTFGLGNPTTTTIAYDAANRVTTMTDYSYTTSMSGGTTTPLATYLYGYDNANRVTSETDKEGLVTFSYDSGGQLLTARGSRTENYSYDFGGNRDMTGYTTGTGNELTSGGGYTFTYDNEGNMTGETQLSTGNNWTFGYDNRNRMVAAEEKSSGGTILSHVSYTYDAENRRIGEDVNGAQTWTAYDGVNPYADFNGAGDVQDRYLYGPAVDEILARIDASGGVAWYLTDRLGTVRDIVNTTGTVLDHVVYDSFGDVTSETNASNGDRFKFTGREYDAATGMYYYRARYYDPATGRFDEQDPMGFDAGDADLYRYVGNDPTGATDPRDPTGATDPRGSLQQPVVPMPAPPPATILQPLIPKIDPYLIPAGGGHAGPWKIGMQPPAGATGEPPGRVAMPLNPWYNPHPDPRSGPKEGQPPTIQGRVPTLVDPGELPGGKDSFPTGAWYYPPGYYNKLNGDVIFAWKGFWYLPPADWFPVNNPKPGSGVRGIFYFPQVSPVSQLPGGGFSFTVKLRPFWNYPQ